jgi:3-oxoadipate enol-lactonase
MGSTRESTIARISKLVDVNGHPTFSEIDGDGPEVMVMMHGLGGSTNYFQPLVSAFAKIYKIIRFDLKGMGRTGPDPHKKRRITIPAYVEDLETILDQEKVENAILVGHSLGSVVAMHFAAKHPSRVSALVAIGPGQSRANNPAATQFTLNMAKNARELGMPAMADGTVAKNVAPSSSDVVRAFVREVVAGQNGEGYAQVCEAACDESHVNPEYAAIKCPSVLIAGDQDLIAPLAQVEEILKKIPGSILRVVRSGHQQVLEDAEGVVAAIKEILR